MAIREEVSGIGSMSKRTDLNVSQQPVRYISGGEYGEGQATYDQQTNAPMYAAETGIESSLPPLTGFSEPTQFPDEPISFGANYGEGPGLSAVLPQPVTMISTVEKALQYDTSGISEFLFNRLNK
jgi:hypothetical protein